MTTNFSKITEYSRYNYHAVHSDIHFFIDGLKARHNREIALEQGLSKSPFMSFAEKRLSVEDVTWLQRNEELFIKDTPNERIQQLDFLPELGYIFCMTYSPEGDHLIVGYSTGLIQAIQTSTMDVQEAIISEFASRINHYYETDIDLRNIWYPVFYQGTTTLEKDPKSWVKKNNEEFLVKTPNKILYERFFFSECGYITALAYSPNGSHIIAGHSSGLIQMRHGITGLVLCTLRQIQFPPKPVYALEYSLLEERVCYAACMDGVIYRIEVPNIVPSTDVQPQYCIKADPALECLDIQFFGAPGISGYCTPYITQRSPVLSMGISNDQLKLIVGYADTSIKVIDMETQATDLIYKVHKLRLQFIPKKLQRMHFGQVCALRCHEDRPFVFASAAWDRTVRVWDTRCSVGCMMTFEGVNVCNDSIDIHRDQCIAGSWQPTDALTVWDLVGKKLLHVVRVQNRRPDVDGEYIYACKYWMSNAFNRKGKYAIIGGSGTNCVEVINLHNRYVSCSYPAKGSVLAVASCDDYIAFGGTAPIFSVVSFHDPKHEKYKDDEDEGFVFKPDPNVVVYENENDSIVSDDIHSPSSGSRKKKR